MNKANPSSVVGYVINHIYFRLERQAYVSERDHDGNGDGTEEHHHAQGEQDALVGRDVNLWQISARH